MAAAAMKLKEKGRNFTQGWANRSWVKRQTTKLARRVGKNLIKKMVDPPANTKVGKGWNW